MMDDIHEQGDPSMTIGVEPGEYMLGVHVASIKRLNSNVRHRRGAQVMGLPSALRHEQVFDLEGDVHALPCFDSVSVSV